MSFFSAPHSRTSRSSPTSLKVSTMHAMWRLFAAAVVLCVACAGEEPTTAEVGNVVSPSTTKSPGPAFTCQVHWTYLGTRTDCINMSLTAVPGVDELGTGGAEIHILDMRRNLFTSLGESSLRGSLLTQLETVVLNSNRLEVVHPEAFRHLPRLRSVELRHNRITHLHANTFRNNPRMQELFLSGNPLSLPSSGSFLSSPVLLMLHMDNCGLTHLPSGVFSELPSLRVLNLATNNLPNISEGSFMGLNSLMFLNLSENALTSFPNNSFSPLQSVKRLDVQKNRLHTINVELFHPLVSLRRLELGGNPLDCDCHLKPFRLWAQNRSLATHTKCGEISWDCLLSMQC